MMLGRRYAVCLMLLLLTGCAGMENDSSPDRQTGLVDLGNGICRQTSNNLMWQIENGPQYETWQEADKYTGTLRLGGYSDWRLPTSDELYMLYYIAALPGKSECKMKLSGNYWSGNSEDKTNAGRWESYPLCGGNELKYVKAKKGFVRAVRP